MVRQGERSYEKVLSLVLVKDKNIVPDFITIRVGPRFTYK